MAARRHRRGDRRCVRRRPRPRPGLCDLPQTAAGAAVARDYSFCGFGAIRPRRCRYRHDSTAAARRHRVRTFFYSPRNTYFYSRRRRTSSLTPGSCRSTSTRITIISVRTSATRSVRSRIMRSARVRSRTLKRCSWTTTRTRRSLRRATSSTRNSTRSTATTRLLSAAAAGEPVDLRPRRRHRTVGPTDPVTRVTTAFNNGGGSSITRPPQRRRRRPQRRRLHTDYRIVAGIKGDPLRGISYDLIASSAHVRTESYKNDFSIRRLSQALDVVADPATGLPVDAAVDRS